MHDNKIIWDLTMILSCCFDKQICTYLMEPALILGTLEIILALVKDTLHYISEGWNTNFRRLNKQILKVLKLAMHQFDLWDILYKIHTLQIAGMCTTFFPESKYTATA